MRGIGVMKYRFYNAVIFTFIIMLFSASAAYANSSWHWVTTSPMTVLPFAIIFTLLIETVGVVRLGKVEDSKKAMKIIALANIISFIAPYMERAYRFRAVSSGISLLFAVFDKGPYYMILSGYLLLTVVVELPVVYYFLSKETVNKKQLAQAIVLSNVITTLLVAVLERMICIGRW